MTSGAYKEPNYSHQWFNSDKIFPDICREVREELKGEVSHLHNIKDQPLALLIMTEIWSVVTFAESMEQEGLYPFT